jgi:hypothetical protein
MLRFHTVGVAGLMFALFANVAGAQSVNQRPERDSLWNGTLIGVGAGVGSAAALDAVFCDNGFGRCDFPWAAYLTLGGIGGAAGAGVDFLIGRTSDGRKTALRLSPIVGRTRKGVLASLVLPQPGSLPPLSRAQERGSGKPRDSIWNGTLIGAGAGAVGGFLWSRGICGWDDDECAVYSGLVGIPVGTGIGAAVGAIADALHH